MTLQSAQLNPLFAAVVGLYLLVVVAIALYGFARTESEADFLVADRSVGPLVGGATLAATQMSAGTLVGAFGIHYLFGVGFIWIWTGLWAGWLVSLVLVAPRLRQFGRVTLTDFIAARYADDGGGGDYARAVSAFVIVVGYAVFLTAQVTAGGLVFQSVLGVPQPLGIGAMALFSVVYTAVGGMRASVLTDLVQAVVMVVGALLAVPLALQVAGGIGTVNAVLGSFQPTLVGQAFSAADLIGFMAASAFYIVAAPDQVTRIYAMRDAATVRTAIGISLVLQAVIAVTIALLGVTMRLLFPTLSTPDLAGVVMSQFLLGPVLGGLFVAAVLSAILSTIDSVLIVSAAGVAHDIYAMLIDPDATERRKLWVNRAAVIVLGLVPVALALNRDLFGGLIQFIVILLLSLLGSAFFAPVLLGLHWRRANTPGGVAGMVVGFGTAVVWHVGTEVYAFLPTVFTRYIGDPVIPGVAASFVAMVTVTLMTREPSLQSLAPFFDTTARDGGSELSAGRKQE
jgi:SSS family transporter